MAGKGKGTNYTPPSPAGTHKESSPSVLSRQPVVDQAKRGKPVGEKDGPVSPPSADPKRNVTD